jgi:hypothetical protein
MVEKEIQRRLLRNEARVSRDRSRQNGKSYEE